MLRKTKKTVISLLVSVLILAVAGGVQYLSLAFPQHLDATTAAQIQAVLGVTSPPTPSSSLNPTSLPTPASPSAAVKVVSVVDGDTIKLETGETVRYIGIDTPETKHPTKGVQCFGQEASRRNQELVKDKYVTLVKDVSQTDRYGRLLRYVWVDGVFINQQLVSEGYAVASSYPPDIARQGDLRMAEQEARAQNRGLWSACATPTPQP